MASGRTAIPAVAAEFALQNRVFCIRKVRFFKDFRSGTAFALFSVGRLWPPSAAFGSVAMIFAAGAAGAAAAAAASSAIELLSSVTSGSKTTGAKQPGSLFSVTPSTDTTQTLSSASATSAPSGGTLSPATFNALLASQDANSSSPTDALKDLFGQIDGNGDGKITKSEFESALGAGGTNIAAADNVFDKMDADGDGSVSLSEMASALKGKGASHHAHHAGGGADALLQALQGATSTTTTNSDGSITTTMTYADGTKLTMNQPASSTTTSGGASSQYNIVEKMVQRQADALASAAKQSVSVKV